MVSLSPRPSCRVNLKRLLLYICPTCSSILVNNLMYIKVAKNCMLTDDTLLSGVGKNPAVSRIVTKIGYCGQRKWSIHLETINGEDASSGPYANALIINFDAPPDFKHLVLYPRYMQAGRA